MESSLTSSYIIKDSLGFCTFSNSDTKSGSGFQGFMKIKSA